jgi:hypothetical protein
MTIPTTPAEKLEPGRDEVLPRSPTPAPDVFGDGASACRGGRLCGGPHGDGTAGGGNRGPA